MPTIAIIVQIQIYFDENFKYILPATKPALTIPKYTREPSNPNSESPIFRSSFIYWVAAGTTPWSILMRMLVRQITKNTSFEPFFSD